MKKHFGAAWVLILFTALPLILFAVLPRRDWSAAEKRYLAEFPAFTAENLRGGRETELLEAYAADHFPGRNFFVGVYAYWNLLLGRNGTESVISGDGGVLVQASATRDLTQMEVNLERFDRFAEASGVPASVVLIPDAGYMLEDLLPANHLPYPDEEAFRLAESCPHLCSVDLRGVFRTERERGSQLYYRTDHHLTSYGCFAAANAFRRAEGLDALDAGDFTVERYPGFHGTVWSSGGYWLTGADDVELWIPPYPVRVTVTEAGEEDVTADSPFFRDNLEREDMYTVFLDGNHTLVRLENPDAAHDAGVLLMIRDSYANCAAPFFAASFRRVVLVDLRYYRGSVSALMAEEEVTEIVFLYGVGNLSTDTNSAWLY